MCDALPAESSGASLHLPSPPTAAEALQLPELVFDELDFSFDVEENTSTPPATPFTATQPDSVAEAETPVTPVLPRIEVHESSPRLRTASLQLPRCLFVDPQSLTASAPASAVDRVSRFWSPAPSPAWLSRNVEGVEPAASSSPLPLPIPPPPSPPLYIVPRSLRPDSYYLREPEVRNDLVPDAAYRSSISSQIEFEFTTAPQTPRSTCSSVTLYNPSQRTSFLAPSSPVNRLSVIYRRSVADNRQSRHSVTFSEEHNGHVITVRRAACMYSGLCLISAEEHFPERLLPSSGDLQPTPISSYTPCPWCVTCIYAVCLY